MQSSSDMACPGVVAVIVFVAVGETTTVAAGTLAFVGPATVIVSAIISVWATTDIAVRMKTNRMRKLFMVLQFLRPGPKFIILQTLRRA